MKDDEEGKQGDNYETKPSTRYSEFFCTKKSIEM